MAPNKLQLAPAYLTQDAPTALRGQAFTIRPYDASHPEQSLIRLPGGDPPRHRKYIRITNEDTGSGSTTGYIVAGDEQSVDPIGITVKIGKISPGEVVELWTNATIYLKNISTTQTWSPIHVLELFYI